MFPNFLKIHVINFTYHLERGFMKKITRENELVSSLHTSDSFIYPLRVIAFSSVFISHAVIPEIGYLPNDPNENINSVAKLLSNFYTQGASGVALFFLISGFVITKAAMRETWKTFIARRIFRILPMYFLALIVFWIIKSVVSNQPSPSLKVVVASLSLLGDFKGAPNQLGGVDWTLRIEILFYAFTALGLILFALFKRAKDVRWVVLTLTGVLAVLVPFLPAFPRGGLAGGYAAIFGPIFLGGIALALHSLRLISVPTLCGILALAYLSSATAQTEFRTDAHYGPFLLWAYGIFLLAYFLYPKAQVNSIMAWLSGLSYSFYLFHAFLFGYLYTLIRETLLKINMESFGDQFFLGLIKLDSLATLFLFVGIMHLLVKTIERPIIKWSRSKFSD